MDVTVSKGFYTVIARAKPEAICKELWIASLALAMTRFF
jgi:hypothetical protein